MSEHDCDICPRCGHCRESEACCRRCPRCGNWPSICGHDLPFKERIRNVRPSFANMPTRAPVQM